ncbi:MAG: glycosyltransferase family 9 protein [Nitrospinota bacterium]
MRRALIVRAGGLGDTLLTLPALAALKERFPGARIEMAGYQERVSLLKAGGLIEEAHSIEAGPMAPLFLPGRPPSSDSMSHLEPFDTLIAWCGRALREHLRGIFRGKFLGRDPLPPRASLTHASGHLLQALSPLGVRPPARKPGLSLRAEEDVGAGPLLEERGLLGEAFIAIHPGGGSDKKCWPAGRFAGLARWTREALGIRVLLVSGPADGKRVAEVLSHLRRESVSLLEEPPLRVLAQVLARASLYLGNDSGVTHLAALVGIPTLALFGPTDPRVWGPIGERVRVIWKGYEELSQGEVFKDESMGRRWLEDIDQGTVARALSALWRQGSPQRIILPSLPQRTQPPSLFQDQ